MARANTDTKLGVARGSRAEVELTAGARLGILGDDRVGG